MTETNENLAMHLVDTLFQRDGDQLMVGGCSLVKLAQDYGTPFFAYDGSVMRRNYRALANTLGTFADIHYSIKANPLPAVIALFLSEGAGVEIASIGEYRKARLSGAALEKILFAGPGKRISELEEVIHDGIGEIHIESYEEIERINAIGLRHGRKIPVGIRINPVATAQGGAMRMGGKPTAFGFDEEDIDTAINAIMNAPHLDLAGIHLFAGTQILDAEVLAVQWAHAIDLAGQVASIANRPLRTIDVGGGLGIPYFSGDKSLDLEKLASFIPDLEALKQANPLIREARIIVEPGRFLVGSAGIYVCSINSVKSSRGQKFYVVDGGMHHHLAASGNLGQIVKRDYPVLAPAHLNSNVFEQVSVVGPLCTPLDTLARKANLPSLVAGDLIAILQSGAYGPTASPNGFLSHPTPIELLIENQKVVQL